jgi:D-3-phosphoglycerate dehydrogenase
MPRALITAVPFGEVDRSSLNLLDAAGVSFDLNPLGRRLKAEELVSLIPGYDVLIAGTEPITDRAIDAADSLRLISRVGVGLDSVDLAAARRRAIAVAYTPEAPADAVAELTIGMALSLLRGVHLANQAIRHGVWRRLQGRRLARVTVGVVGVGRIGGRVIKLLSAFGGRILGNDLTRAPVDELNRRGANVEWVEFDTLLRESDIVTLHVPLTRGTRHLVGAGELAVMRRDALLINTCRGGVVDEAALATALRAGRLGGAAVDTFSHEPYDGELVGVETCLMTPHMGSMAADCRLRMEQGAAQNAVAFLRGDPLDELVPESEYELQQDGPSTGR